MLMLHPQPAGVAPTGPSMPVPAPPYRLSTEEVDFNPADMRCWLTRGRSVEHATALATIWQAYPDLAPTAPLEDRMARGRERIRAMKPLNDAIAARTEAERQRTNFGLMERRAANDTIEDRDLAILRGRDDYGYDWDSAVAYAGGWSAADAGREYSFYPDGSGREASKRAAYDRGFADGGGDQDDLFDAARRSNLAALRRHNQPTVAPSTAAAARPQPSSWPKPNDHARPTHWSRRLMIVSDVTIEEVTPGLMQVSDLRLMEEVLARLGTADMTIVTIDRLAGFVVGHQAPTTTVPIDATRADEIIADVSQGETLRTILAGREIDDILIAVQGDYLRISDEGARFDAWRLTGRDVQSLAEAGYDLATVPPSDGPGRAYSVGFMESDGDQWLVNASNSSLLFKHLIEAEAHLWSVFASVETRHL